MLNPNLVDVIRYAESMLHVPYIFGGNHPRTGLDCSGFICIVLRSVGLIGLKEDLRAVDIFKKFSQPPGTPQDTNRPATGSLLFYGASQSQISHVSLVVSPYTVIEAGGGGSSMDTIKEADASGAGVRRCSIHHRADKVAAIYPCYPWEN